MSVSITFRVTVSPSTLSSNTATATMASVVRTAPVTAVALLPHPVGGLRVQLAQFRQDRHHPAHGVVPELGARGKGREIVQHRPPAHCLRHRLHALELFRISGLVFGPACLDLIPQFRLARRLGKQIVALVGFFSGGACVPRLLQKIREAAVRLLQELMVPGRHVVLFGAKGNPVLHRPRNLEAGGMQGRERTDRRHAPVADAVQRIGDTLNAQPPAYADEDKQHDRAQAKEVEFESNRKAAHVFSFERCRGKLPEIGATCRHPQYATLILFESHRPRRHALPALPVLCCGDSRIGDPARASKAGSPGDERQMVPGSECSTRSVGPKHIPRHGRHGVGHRERRCSLIAGDAEFEPHGGQRGDKNHHDHDSKRLHLPLHLGHLFLDARRVIRACGAVVVTYR
nr:hypothetical protein [Thauera sp. K11]